MLLYGCGGHSKVVADGLAAQGIIVKGVFDDQPKPELHYGIKVIGNYQANIFPSEPMIISIGDNLMRKSVAKKVNHRIGKLQHPSAVISFSSFFDEGTVVFQLAVVQADVKIGKHVIINTGAIIEHDCVIGDFVHISPRATICGLVTIGEGTWIGAGATVIPGITIGNWCVIGAGAVVVEDVPNHSLVVGVPGVVVKKLKSSEI